VMAWRIAQLVSLARLITALVINGSFSEGGGVLEG
jgi:hypothetical protein